MLNLLLICLIFASVFFIGFFSILAVYYKLHPEKKQLMLKQFEEDKVRRQIETKKSLEQIKIDHEQRMKQIKIDREPSLKQIKIDREQRMKQIEKDHEQRMKQIKIDHEQRMKQIEKDREQRRLARIPSRQTLRVTIVSKTPNYLQSGYYKEVLLFEDAQHSRFSFTLLRKESDLLAVGDTGVLTFDQYTTGKQTFVSFTPDPATPVTPNPNPSA